MKHRYSHAFALPVVMISSVVMMMVLLSGLTAATSVNVGIRSQYEDKLMQAAAASGIAMAKDCIARSDNAIMWTSINTLRPNTNCDGIEQLDCPTTSTDERCYVAKSGTYRSTFSVNVTTSGGETSITSQASLRQVRQANGSVIKQYTMQKKATVDSNVSIVSSSATASPNVGLSNIVTGEQHACGIDIGGKAYCWGSNSSGQLGNGSTTSSSTPVAVQMPAGVTVMVLTAGMAHTCAIGSNGIVYCWGNNAVGQLGNNTITSASIPGAIWQGTVPADVTLRDLSAGNYHTCGVGSNGKIYCWGSNGSGQLGDSSTVDKRTPVTVFQGAVPANTALLKVGAGVGFTCAISEAGKAYCWGFNGSVQLGNSSSIANSTTPVAVSPGMIPGNVTARSISVGSESACVLGFNNKVYCWGNGAQGQLGYGNITNQWAPVAVIGGDIPSNAVIQSINVGYYHACAVTSNNKVYCWGQNNFGQLGNGGSSNASSPVAVAQGTTQFSNIAGGFLYTCGVTSEAKAMCWGNNGSGRLGNGNTTNSSALVNVSGGSSAMPLGIRQVDMGGDSYEGACAINTTNRVYCWGSNASGQFGNGNTTSATIPVAGLTTLINDTTSVVSVSIGSGTTGCLLTSTGVAKCVGNNTYGQIGDGTSNNSKSTPVNVAQGNRPAGVDFISLKTKGYYTCGIGTNGKAYCWGYNNIGQLGNGSTTNSSSPVAVSQGAIPAGVGLKQVSPSGYLTTCAIGSNDRVYCWGFGDSGQLGNGSNAHSFVPVLVSQGAVPAGVKPMKVDGTCMLGSNEWVYCWGDNYYGKLANGATTTFSTTPVAILRGAIPAGVTIKDISVGESDTVCVLGSNGKIYCWGYNVSGQTGVGYNSYDGEWLPVAVAQGVVPSGVSMKSVSVGRNSTCATASNLQVYCWGANTHGQLGNGSTTQSYTPIAAQQRLSFRGSNSKIGAGLNSSLLFTY